MEGKIYLIENQDDEMLGLFVFLKNKLCAKMMISLRLELFIGPPKYLKVCLKSKFVQWQF